ncbi:MAG: preprotein translocase subunit SecG [Sphingomonadaceae bacterium]|nr:preprotein translocase subunit SecG [Sphingomonadaceae bacterium]
MSLFLFLTVVQALIAAALVGVILMQRSEGGGLGVGGNTSGLMSARGAADFLTRATAVLAVLFVLLSIGLAALAVDVTSSRDIDTSLDRSASQAPPAPVDPLAGVGAGGASGQGGGLNAPEEDGASAPSQDPLAGAAKQ